MNREEIQRYHITIRETKEGVRVEPVAHPIGEFVFHRDHLKALEALREAAEHFLSR